MLSHPRYIAGHLGLLPLLLLLAMVTSVLTACEDDKKEVVSGYDDPERTPTMLTRNVETLISDSGIMRYRVTSPMWLVYDEAKVPYWKFPNGLKLEKYDDFFHVQATVMCDSAFFYKNEQIWRLDGNVKIENAAKEKFLSNQLFWNQRQHKVYSDSFIRIEQPDRMIEGYGFISNDRMTSYSIRRVSGVFPVEGLRKQATSVDSTGAPKSPDGTFHSAPAPLPPSAIHGRPQAAPSTNPALTPGDDDKNDKQD